jgi:hypothetical protein
LSGGHADRQAGQAASGEQEVTSVDPFNHDGAFRVMERGGTSHSRRKNGTRFP